MENSFFRNYWNSCPRYSPNTRGTHLHHQQMKSPSANTPKVVSIPVHFVGSEKSKSAAALKIQKVFRGFLVRKSVKKIVGIRGEVDEIERRISQRETADLIRRNSKERLKVNEMLMALLFQLDSVRGVDSGVRDCRKAVIRKAIMLQERVDAVVVGDQTLHVVDGEAKGHSLELEDRADPSGTCEPLAEAAVQTLEITDSADSSEDCEIVESAVDQTLETQDPVESERDSGDSGPVVVEAAEQTLGFQGHVESSAGDGDRNATVETQGKSGATELAENSETKADEEGSSSEDKLQNHDPTPSSSEEVVEENAETENMTESSVKSQSSVEEGGETPEEQKKDAMEIQQPNQIQEREKSHDDSRVLMERMIKENEKLMGLVTELCERNALQTHMITSLSQRVENLERAFRSERLRRKKKRQAAAIVERLEKCGRKS